MGSAGARGADPRNASAADAAVVAAPLSAKYHMHWSRWGVRAWWRPTGRVLLPQQLLPAKRVVQPVPFGVPHQRRRRRRRRRWRRCAAAAARAMGVQQRQPPLQLRLPVYLNGCQSTFTAAAAAVGQPVVAIAAAAPVAAALVAIAAAAPVAAALPLSPSPPPPSPPPPSPPLPSLPPSPPLPPSRRRRPPRDAAQPAARRCMGAQWPRRVVRRGFLVRAAGWSAIWTRPSP